MSLLDIFTGGKNDDATKALNKGYAAYDGVAVPDAAQLTLPQLEQYVQAGIMTPAQAQAVLQKQNAYDSLKTDPRAKEAEMTALNQLQDVAANKGMDAQAKAKLAETQSTMNQNLQGQRASVLDQMAARGIPTSLMGTAAQLAFAGQDNEQAHKDAMQASADAEQRALAAMTGAGSMAGQIQNQNFNEGSVKAQSQNAIDQWNAANQTNVNLANQQAQQQANVVNNSTAQNVSNANVANANARTQYNAQVPQTVYQDQLQKASGKAGVSAQQAANATAQGQQNAGLYGSIIGAGATMLGGPVAGALASGALNNGQKAPAAPATNQDPMQLARGGEVPGKPNVPGDSLRNDKVPALLSPQEVVLPRSVAHSPNLAAEFVRHLHKAQAPRAVHPEDVKSVLHALGAMRGGF